jgi:predicted enzyme related to lactoylglutathione lyase
MAAASAKVSPPPRQLTTMADRTRGSGSSSTGTQTSQATSTGAAQGQTTRSGSAATQVARPGSISHTEFASRDPAATRAFCETLFGWTFETLEGPTGPYHMFRFQEALSSTPASAKARSSRLPIPVETEPSGSGEGSSAASGGGIRAIGKAEAPLAIPYVEVADIRQAESDATRAGARVISPRLSMGSGSIVVLQIPGGPHIGLWAPK